MAVEPPYSEPRGPESIKPNALRAVSHQIERYYDQRDEEPERSKDDEDFWILGMAPEDVPTLYKLPKEHAVYVIMCHNVGEGTIRDRADHFNVEVSDAMIHEYRRR